MCASVPIDPALVVGGSRGLGAALVRKLRQGGDVTSASRSGTRPYGEPFDITKPETYAKIGVHEYEKVYLTAGVYGAGPLAQMDDAKIEELVQTHVLGYMRFIAAFHRRRMKVERPQPYDLIVIGSTLAHVPGKMHAVLAGCKAAKVHFARTFALELERDIPGSKVFIFNPWGMKTDFFAGTTVKMDSFMDPDFVAEFICDKVYGEGKVDRSRPGAIEFTLDRATDPP